MDLTKPLLAAVLLAVTATAGAEQLYKWVDSNGKVRYSDAPQAGWKRVDAPAAAPGLPAAPDASDEEDDTELTPDEPLPTDEPEATDQSEKAAAEPADPEPSAALKASECKKRQEQLAGYEKASRIVEKDAKGKEKTYSETDRLKLIERTRQQVKELCG